MANELTEWRPFSDLGDLRHRLDQVFRDLGDGDRAWSPPVDVVREDDAVKLRVDLPGIKPDDVKIELEGDVLTVSGEHSESSERKEEHYVRRERRSGSFRRSLMVPSGVDADQIEATTADGVLEVRIPLPAPEEKRKIEINSKDA